MRGPLAIVGDPRTVEGDWQGALEARDIMSLAGPPDDHWPDRADNDEGEVDE